MTDDLKTLFPDPIMVDIGGERLEIRPFASGILLKKVLPLMKGLDLTSFVFGEKPSEEVITNLVMENGDTAIKLAVYGSGKDEAWVDALPPGLLVRLLGAIIKANIDFFVREVLPELGGAVKSLKESIRIMARSSEG